MGSGRERSTFVDSADPDDPKRTYHRLQIVSSAGEHGYFANIGEFSCWARLGLMTESGRAEILVALHALGQDYRGVIAASG